MSQQEFLHKQDNREEQEQTQHPYFWSDGKAEPREESPSNFSEPLMGDYGTGYQERRYEERNREKPVTVDADPIPGGERRQQQTFRPSFIRSGPQRAGWTQPGRMNFASLLIMIVLLLVLAPVIIKVIGFLIAVLGVLLVAALLLLFIPITAIFMGYLFLRILLRRTLGQSRSRRSWRRGRRDWPQGPFWW